MVGGTALRILVRALSPEDAAAWHNLQLGIYREQQWFVGDTPPPADALSRKLLAVDASYDLYLGALVGGVLVGWLELHRYTTPRLSHVAVLTLAVALPYRRRGLGRRLLQEAYRWARRVGVEKLQLNVRAGNLAARALYRSEGFSEEGREVRQLRQGDYYEDNLLLAKFL
jgi:ribosomal protein S18 acetylase RimI-like enzyme